MKRHVFPSLNPGGVVGRSPFPGNRLERSYRECFLELYVAVRTYISAYSLSAHPDETSVTFFVTLEENMGVSSAFLGVNTTNDIGGRTETDVTSSISGGTTISYDYAVGAPNQTRYFWLRLVDTSGNESISYLGPGTTADLTAPTVDSFALTTGPTPTSSVSVTLAASDNDAVATLYLLLSSTVTTPPTPSEIKNAGLALPGVTTAHTFTGLAPGTTFYGWVLARDQVGNESAVVASTPATLATVSDTTPPQLDGPASVTPTPGAEESSLTIVVNISDST